LRFVDPSVQFGVQFEQLAAPDDTEEIAPKDQAPARPPAEHKPHAVVPAPVNAAPALPAENGNKPPAGAQVVRLDRFRKK
jgi:hypothetical protein